MAAMELHQLDGKTSTPSDFELMDFWKDKKMMSLAIGWKRGHFRRHIFWGILFLYFKQEIFM